MGSCFICGKETDYYSEDYPVYLCSLECDYVIEIVLELVTANTMCARFLVRKDDE